MKRKTFTWLSGIIWTAIALFALLVPETAYAQRIRNGGTIRNNSGQTINARQFDNGRNGNSGTLINAGTVNVTNGGGFFNFDSTNNNGFGTVRNYIGGTAAGIVSSRTVSNGNGLFDNDSTFTYTGELRTSGSISNGGTGTFDTDSGIVVYNSGSDQTIFSTNYGDLRTATGGIKTTSSSVVVSRQIDIGVSTTLEVGASTLLTLDGTSPFSGATGTFDADAVSAEVRYNAAGSQDVRGANYHHLTIAAGGTKTVNTGAATVLVNGTLNNSATFDIVANALTTGATSTITNSATIRTQGSVTFGTSHTIGGTFIYEAAVGTQSIGQASYANLTLQSGTGAAGQKDFPALTTVSVSGTYSATGGDRNYSTGTFAYNGTGASSIQSILGGESYNNLSITGSSDTTFAVGGYKQAGSGFTLAGSLTIDAGNVLDMQSNSITGGLAGSSNSGKIMWAAGNSHAISGTGTTEFYGASNATVLASAVYGPLLFSGSGVKTVGGAVTSTGAIVMNNLTVSSPSGNLTVNGDFDNAGVVTNDGTITVQ